MPVPFQGGCACGEIRYECAAEPLIVIHCHCRDCQRSSGTQMGTTAFIPRSAFKLLTGTPRSCEFTADSGNILIRQFCGTCGSPLFLDPRGFSHVWGVKAASLDDPSWLKPGVHIWTESAQPWDRIGDELPCHPGNLPSG
jgi:hypothetical protein